MRRPYLSAKARDAIAAAYVEGVPVAVIAARHKVCLSYPSILARRRQLKPRTKRRAVEGSAP